MKPGVQNGRLNRTYYAAGHQGLAHGARWPVVPSESEFRSQRGRCWALSGHWYVRRPMVGCHFEPFRKTSMCLTFRRGRGAAIGNQDWRSDVGFIDQRSALRQKLQSFTLVPRTMTETRCDRIETWKLTRRRPTLALPKSECLSRSSRYRRPYIFRPTSLLS